MKNNLFDVIDKRIDSLIEVNATNGKQDLNSEVIHRCATAVGLLMACIDQKYTMAGYLNLYIENLRLESVKENCVQVVSQFDIAALANDCFDDCVAEISWSEIDKLTTKLDELDMYDFTRIPGKMVKNRITVDVFRNPSRMSVFSISNGNANGSFVYSELDDDGSLATYGGFINAICTQEQYDEIANIIEPEGMFYSPNDKMVYYGIASEYDKDIDADTINFNILKLAEAISKVL